MIASTICWEYFYVMVGPCYKYLSHASTTRQLQSFACNGRLLCAHRLASQARLLDAHNGLHENWCNEPKTSSPQNFSVYVPLTRDYHESNSLRIVLCNFETFEIIWFSEVNISVAPCGWKSIAVENRGLYCFSILRLFLRSFRHYSTTIALLSPLFAV